MQNTLPQNNIEALFSNYLSSLYLSSKTLKNYRSDISHFTGWLILKMRAYGVLVEKLSDAVPFLNNKIGAEYKTYLAENNVPLKTLNRRLSTLRHLSKFLTEAQIIDFDFMQGLPNLSVSKNVKDEAEILLDGFQAHLLSRNVSKNTAKNYLSDVRQFIAWAQKYQEK